MGYCKKVQWNKFYEQLKNISILSVCNLLNIPVYRSNLIRCISPNHDDHHPSLKINTAKNYWKCFSCGEGGDVITFVMVATGLDFKDACNWLASNFNIPNPNMFSNSLRNLSVPHISKRIKPKTSNQSSIELDTELMTWIVNHGSLSNDANNFLFSERKLQRTVIESLKIFSISDTDKFINALLREFGEERCVKSRILIKSFDKFYPCFIVPAIIFPFYDPNGSLITLQSRTLFPQKPSDRFRFPKNSPIIPFNLPSLLELEPYDTVYITEGVTDCLAHLSEGHNAVAFPGAQSFSIQYAKLLEGFTLKMYPDSDSAGQSLYSKLSDALTTSIFRVDLPAGVKDYSDFHIINYGKK